jgi:hypothetical protein
MPIGNVIFLSQTMTLASTTCTVTGQCRRRRQPDRLLNGHRFDLSARAAVN